MTPENKAKQVSMIIKMLGEDPVDDAVDIIASALTTTVSLAIENGIMEKDKLQVFGNTLVEKIKSVVQTYEQSHKIRRL